MKVFRPKTIAEALALQKETNADYIAGGTFSMVEITSGRYSPAALIDLSLCDVLYGINELEDTVEIGALTTFTDIEKSEVLNRLFPTLTKAAAEVGGPQVRNRGTVGGNICAASPAADAVPPLLALRAEAVVIGSEGERVLPLSEMFLAPKKTCLAKDDILTVIRIPKENTRNSFMKIGKRNALAVSCANMAVALRTKQGSITDIRVSVGSCAPTPRLCPKTAEMLLGDYSTEKLTAAKEILMTEISPIDDRWATAEYRRLVVRNMLEHLVEELLKEGE